jgi:phosphoribosylamine---glycine ligase
MTVLLVGGGGREHAIAWRLRRDDPATSIIAAPGNPGIAELAECVPVGATDVDALVQLARSRRVSYAVVGPEAPLAAGIVDRFRREKLPIFGPTRAAAEIETSKAFAKGLMQEAGVPTARAITATEVQRARKALREFGAPVVIKASGLAAGKGVIVCSTLEEADRAVEQMLVGGAFGVAGSQVLIEEFMTGEELSLFAMTDGQRVVPLVAAQDHKRLLEGDQGPNTGGMGAYAPVTIATPALVADVTRTILQPTVDALAARGRPFTGLLYAGLMITTDGPRVVEFNCRFGDPETQAVLPILRLSVPFAELLAAVARGDSLPADVAVSATGHALTTVLASPGYPDAPRTGVPISVPPGLEALIFHAGTGHDGQGRLVTSGGRVLAVTGTGPRLADAHERSLDAARLVEFDGKHFRSDIGWRERERSARAS